MTKTAKFIAFSIMLTLVFSICAVAGPVFGGSVFRMKIPAHLMELIR